MLSNDDDGTFRYDAEHYQKKYKRINEILIGKKSSKLISYLKKTVVTGHTPSMKIDKFYGGDIKFIKTDNVRENKITSSFTDYLTIEGSLELESSNLKEHDILVTIIGATFDIVGRCATIQKEHLPANINQNIALIRVDTSKINSNYLSIYLNTKYGRGSLHYHSRQTEQVNLNCREVERVLVPIFPVLELKISEVCEKANSLIAESKSTYTATETLLLQTLGLANFSPSTEQVNIKSFKDSFGTSGRLDAEYYQPKYEQVVAHITSQSYAKLSTLVTIQKSIEPGSEAYTEDGEEGLPFLRVADYSKLGLTKPQKQLKQSFVDANNKLIEKLIPKANTILFSKDGSVGEAYCLRQDADFITSGAVLHLTINKSAPLLPDYLTLALNSKLVKMQSERDAGGSIILHWRVSEIEQVVVPLVDMAIQTQIATLIQQSFTLKAQSEHLLEVAKRAVEIAIEQNEQAAMDYINVQMGA